MEKGFNYDDNSGISLTTLGGTPLNIASSSIVSIGLTGNNTLQLYNFGNNNSFISYGITNSYYWSEGLSVNGGLNDWILYDNVNYLTRLRLSNQGLLSITGTLSVSNGITSNYHNITNTTPEYRLTTNDGYYSRLQRSSTGNTTYLKGMVNQSSGTGNALYFTNTNQYFSVVDTGLPSGSRPIFSISFWFNMTSVFASSFVSYGIGAGALSIQLYTGSIQIYIGQQSGTNQTLFNISAISSGWYNLVLTCDGTNTNLYLNNSLIGTISTIYSITTGGNLTSNSLYNNFTYAYSNSGKIDQLLMYNTCLSGTSIGGDIYSLYNVGNGTGTPPKTSNLLRRYDFDNNGLDTNTVGTQYNLSLFNSPTYTTGKVPVVSGVVEGIPITYSDGVYASEKGTLLLGDISSGTWLQGLSIKALINNSTIPFIIGSNGYVLINPTNTSQTATSSYPLTVVGGDISVNGITIGVGAGGLNSNVAIGLQALQLMTRGNNTAVGYQAAQNATGQYTTAVGTAALQNVTGQFNSAFGISSLLNLTSGGSNVAIGHLAGAYILGGVTKAQTNSNSIFIGYAAYPLANGDTNEIVIGYNAVGNGSNTIVIGNSASTSMYIPNIVSTSTTLLNYVNDAAAAAGGVPIGGIYNTSGVLKIRLT